ncbi:MAG: homocysteine S-methyltransferase [Actinomycetota bacterium]|nr:homocysteine S-methyltransferase [Actinomycetota bacterium]
MATRDPFGAFPGAIVLDGGLATELERRGADLRDDLWSAKVLIEEPDRIIDVHRAYVDAGADVLISASYQASFEGFARKGLNRARAAELMARSVELARSAADGAGRPVLVAASVGPYGAVLADGSEYTGRYHLGERSAAVAALREFHRPRAEVLAAAEPDLLAVETIPSIAEAEALADVLPPLGIPAWVSFSCGDGERLNDGTLFGQAVDVVATIPGVVAVGVNCTPPADVAPLLRIARSRTDKPLVAYPNRGATWDAASKSWVGDAVPEGFGPLARSLRDAGARLVGGCCGSGPADIHDVAAALRPAA